MHVCLFQGYLIGNPSTGEIIDISSKVPYAHGVGIISDQLYEVTKLERVDPPHMHVYNTF